MNDNNKSVPMGQYPPPSYPGPGAGDGYGGQPSYPGATLNSGHQTVLVVPGQAQEGEAGAAVSMTGAYLSACLTFWLCGNVLFGFIGFILAIVGSSFMGTNNKLSRQLSISSMIVTWVGFVVTVIVIIVVVVIMVKRVEAESTDLFGQSNNAMQDGMNAVNDAKNALNGLFTTTPSPWYSG